MSTSDTWCRPSVWGCSAVLCVIRVQAAEHCLLSCCPGGLPNRDAFSHHWLSAGGPFPELVRPKRDTPWAGYCIRLWRKKKGAFVLVMSNQLSENLLGLTVAFVSANSWADTWWVTVESPMDSYALILGHKWKPLEWLQDVASSQNVCLGDSRMLLAWVIYIRRKARYSGFSSFTGYIVTQI